MGRSSIGLEKVIDEPRKFLNEGRAGGGNLPTATKLEPKRPGFGPPPRTGADWSQNQDAGIRAGSFFGSKIQLDAFPPDGRNSKRSAGDFGIANQNSFYGHEPNRKFSKPLKKTTLNPPFLPMIFSSESNFDRNTKHKKTIALRLESGEILNSILSRFFLHKKNLWLFCPHETATALWKHAFRRNWIERAAENNPLEKSSPNLLALSRKEVFSVKSVSVGGPATRSCQIKSSRTRRTRVVRPAKVVGTDTTN